MKKIKLLAALFHFVGVDVFLLVLYEKYRFIIVQRVTTEHGYSLWSLR
jgi:hypothetical protein